jgi:hypothetical protein
MGMYPECLTLPWDVKMVGEHAVAAGSFGEVWHGKIQRHDVAVKILNIYQRSDVEKLLKVCDILQVFII